MPTLNLTFPFNSALSENNRLGWSPRAGRMYAKQDYKVQKGALTVALAFQKARKRAKFDPGQRVWVSLMVYRPNEHFDASNFIKPINDAISEVIGVNDNKFDGEYKGFVDKKNPHFCISIVQQ